MTPVTSKVSPGNPAVAGDRYAIDDNSLWRSIESEYVGERLRRPSHAVQGRSVQGEHYAREPSKRHLNAIFTSQPPRTSPFTCARCESRGGQLGSTIECRLGSS